MDSNFCFTDMMTLIVPRPGALQLSESPPLSPSVALHSQVDSDMAVCDDLWELLEDADGE